MARSKRQYENEIRTVVVGKVAKEFRKAGLVSKVIEKAKANNQVVTGGLINPEQSKSIFPTSDDNWLIDRDSVNVTVSAVDNLTKLPVDVRIEVDIEAGLSYKYWWLSSESKSKSWKPDGWKIQDWVEKRLRRGTPFYIINPNGTTRPAKNNAMDRNRISYMVFKKLTEKGIDKTDLTDPFIKGNNSAAKVAQRGFDKAIERVAELYDTYIVDGFANATIDLI
jgi:hypothetical protein